MRSDEKMVACSSRFAPVVVVVVALSSGATSVYRDRFLLSMYFVVVFVTFAAAQLYV